jgi:hypothetical protein
MDLEPQLEQSLSGSRARDALKESIKTVLRKMGWKGVELTRATELLTNKLASLPAVDNGVTVKRMREG